MVLSVLIAVQNAPEPGIAGGQALAKVWEEKDCLKVSGFQVGQGCSGVVSDKNVVDLLPSFSISF